MSDLPPELRPARITFSNAKYLSRSEPTSQNLDNCALIKCLLLYGGAY